MAESSLCTRCQAVLAAITTAMSQPSVAERLLFSTDEEEYFRYESKRWCQLCKFWACQIGQIMTEIDAVMERSATNHHIIVHSTSSVSVMGSISCHRRGMTAADYVLTTGAFSLYSRPDNEKIVTPILAFPPLQDNTINTGLVKHWIDTCQSQHPRCRLPCNTLLPTGFRLIDCQLKKIVKVSEPTPPYLALSYVWGATHATQTVNDSDPFAHNQAPQTIRDAMTFTIQLGFRYLWVDRYCIDQTNEDDKLEQIDRMGDIYYCAEMTLIAAVGPDASSGLPGVGGSARPVPKAARTGVDDFIAIELAGLRFLYRINYMRTAIPNSRWASRGWTYQEGLLSRRRLVFTEHYGNFLYFHCRESRALEPASFVGCSGYDDDSISNVFPSVWADSMADDAYTIFDLIGNYTRRTLGRQSDALRAVKGVLSAYETSRRGGKEPAYTVWGVPAFVRSVSENRQLRFMYASHDALHRFIASLLWSSPLMGGYARRTEGGFPSWSWLGWCGEPLWSRDVEFPLASGQFEIWLHPSGAGEKSTTRTEPRGALSWAEFWPRRMRGELAGERDLKPKLTLRCFALKISDFFPSPKESYVRGCCELEADITSHTESREALRVVARFIQGPECIDDYRHAARRGRVLGIALGITSWGDILLVKKGEDYGCFERIGLVSVLSQEVLNRHDLRFEDERRMDEYVVPKLRELMDHGFFSCVEIDLV